MQFVEQQVLEGLRTLSPVHQQEVLNFVEFLRVKQNKQPPVEQSEIAVSFLEAAKKYVGCLEGGPPDLSTNKRYMEGFGES